MYCNCNHCDTRNIMNIEENLERCTLNSSHGNVHDGTEIGVGLIPLSSPIVLDGEEPRGPETDSNGSSTSEVDLHQPDDRSPDPSISSHETLGEPPALAVRNSEPSSSSNGISYIDLPFCDAEDIDSADHAEPSTSGLQNPVPKSESPCHLPATKPIQDTGNSETTTFFLNASEDIESPIWFKVDNTSVNQSLVSRMFETVFLWSYYFKSSNQMRIRGLISYFTLTFLIVTNGINISSVLIISSKISPVCYYTNLWIYPFIGMCLLDNIREIYLWHHRCNSKPISRFWIGKPVNFDMYTVFGSAIWSLTKFLELTPAVVALVSSWANSITEDVSRSKAQSGVFLSVFVLFQRCSALYYYKVNCSCVSKLRSLRQKVILLMFNYLITLSLIILYIISFELYIKVPATGNLFVYNIQSVSVMTAIMNNLIIGKTVIHGAEEKFRAYELIIHIFLVVSTSVYLIIRLNTPYVDPGIVIDPTC